MNLKSARESRRGMKIEELNTQLIRGEVNKKKLQMLFDLLCLPENWKTFLTASRTSVKNFSKVNFGLLSNKEKKV